MKNKTVAQLKQEKINEVIQALIEYNKKFFELAEEGRLKIEVKGKYFRLMSQENELLMTTLRNTADIPSLAEERVSDKFKYKKDFGLSIDYFLETWETLNDANAYIYKKIRITELEAERSALESQIEDLKDELADVESELRNLYYQD